MDLVTKLANFQLKRLSVKLVIRLITMHGLIEINIQKEKQNNDKSNNQSARFTGNKKTTNFHLVTDDSEDNMQRGHSLGDTTTYCAKGCSEVWKV